MASSKGKKTTSSTSRTRGRTSVDKGKTFEQEVADLYRLLGANVVQNIEVCQKKVDILATFSLPGSSTGHRVIVECKDEKRPVKQNQRVMQFAGLLDLARKAGEAESAEIITRIPWSDQAKGFGKARGIGVLTYKDMISKLMDFGPYLKSQIYFFKQGSNGSPSEPPLESYYVDLSAHIAGEEEKKISDLDSYIWTWLDDRAARHLAILGEYGTGKTCFCKKITCDLATDWIASGGTKRIPLLFNLRDFTKTLSIEALISHFLDSVCGISNPRFMLFDAMNKAGSFLLIFDGFDEMAVRVDSDTLEINLREIEKLAYPENSKIIITSRLEYFVSAEEQTRLLQPRGELLTTRDVEYQPLQIQPWTSEKIESFLKKRVPLIPGVKENWSFYKTKIENIPGLSDLARRPVLLEMIVKTLPQLVTSGLPINRPNLYQTYLIGELKRQKILKKRILLLSEAERLSVLQGLALLFYQEEESCITFSESLEHINSCIQPPRTEIEAYARDFLNCSFLVRKADQFHFSHRSILEYLIARGILVEIESKKPKAFKKQKLDRLVAGFLKEMEPKRQTLLDWIEQTKSSDIKESMYLGGNSVTILLMRDPNALTGKNLSGTILMGAHFSEGDLTKTDFSGAILKNVNLESARFSKEILSVAQLEDVVFRIALCFRSNSEKNIQLLKSNNIHKVMDQMFYRNASESRLLSWFIRGEDSYLIGSFSVECKDLFALDNLRKGFSKKFDVQFSAIYADEFDKLSSTLPKDISRTLWSRRVFTAVF